ncbi:MAG: hypothetical protein WCY65_03365 [Candidatus Methanomethylophilaceae archaeon]
MKKMNKGDRRAMGGLAGAVLLILLVVLIIIGATVAMPFVGKQTIKEGDYLIYSMNSSDGDNNIYTIIFLDVGTTSMEIATVTSGTTTDVDSATVAYEYQGNVLQMNMEFFLDTSVISGFDSSYWMVLSGFTPILVQQYSGTVLGLMNYTVMVKMGTNLVVGMDISYGDNWTKVRLVDSNILWVKAV